MTTLDDFVSRADADAFEAALNGSSSPSLDLAGLLETARQVSSVTIPGPDTAFVASLGARLQAEATALADAPRSSQPGPASGGEQATVINLHHSWPKVLAGAAAGVIVAGTGLGIASQDALPGDALYAVRSAVDGLEVRLAGGEGEQGRALLAQAREHLDDATTLAERDDLVVDDVRTALDGAAATVSDGDARLFAAFDEDHDPAHLAEVRSFTTWAEPRLAHLRQTLPPELQGDLVKVQTTIDAGATTLEAKLASCGDDCRAAVEAVSPPRTATSTPTTALTTSTVRPSEPATTPSGSTTTSSTEPAAPPTTRPTPSASGSATSGPTTTRPTVSSTRPTVPREEPTRSGPSTPTATRTHRPRPTRTPVPWPTSWPSDWPSHTHPTHPTHPTQPRQTSTTGGSSTPTAVTPSAVVTPPVARPTHPVVPTITLTVLPPADAGTSGPGTSPGGGVTPTAAPVPEPTRTLVPTPEPPRTLDPTPEPTGTGDPTLEPTPTTDPTPSGAVVTPQAPVFATHCVPGRGIVHVPTVTGVRYLVLRLTQGPDLAVVVEANPSTGYVLAPGATRRWVREYPDCR